MPILELTAAVVRREQAARAWLAARDTLVWWCFIVACAVGIPLDIWLVNSGHRSITNIVTQQCQAHDTLIALGMLVTVAVAYAVQRYRWMCWLTLIVGGHLFTGMVAP